MDMTGRRVMVTGASSGLGRETAIFLSRLGATVVLVARDEQRLQATMESMAGTGHKICQFDFSSDQEVTSWLKQIAKETGPFHGLAHCAGIQAYYPVGVLSSDAMLEMYKVNTVSGALLVRAFQQKGCHHPESSIVLVASTAALVGVPANTPYSASKAAIISMVKGLSLELAPKKIRLNCVAPAVFKTEMVSKVQELMTEESFQAIIDAHPLGLGEPVDVAYAIAFLLAPAARWITGSALVIDGGLTAL